MALSGTLRDFGIADIFQLISQQTKTGVLHLRNKDEEVHISFHEGMVVRAEHRSRSTRDLLGGMLRGAGLIGDEELDQALEEQKRTLRRLGDILIDRGSITPDQLKEMTQLQATETLYRLFAWKNGTYGFEQGMVEWDRDTITPIRAESVLMEGFRMVDEWPIVRRIITSPLMTFERVRTLPPAQPGDGGLELEDDSGGSGGVGPKERRVMSLVTQGRTVEQLVDLARLGEFETNKALFNLVQAGFLRAVPPRQEDLDGRRTSLKDHLAAFAARLALSAAILALVLAIAWHWRVRDVTRDAGTEGARFTDAAAQRLVAASQLARLRAALGVYRLEHGRYPESLRDAVTAGLLDEADLTWPWVEAYHYRRAEERPEGYVLLPPLR